MGSCWAVPDKSTFYVVDHVFKKDVKPEEWWAKMQEMMSKPDEFKAFFKSNTDQGFYNHAFLPITQTHVICIWECKPGATVRGLQKLLDETVTQGVMVNKCMRISDELSGGQMPFPAAYAKESALPMDSSTSYPAKSAWYLIQHDMKQGKAAEWWDGMQKMMSDEAQMKAFAEDAKSKGFVNHIFMPISQNLCYCLWECKEAGMDKALQAFLDETVGRGCFVNTLLPLPAALSGGQAPCEPQLNTGDDFPDPSNPKQACC